MEEHSKFKWHPMPRYKMRKYLVGNLLKKVETKNKSCLEIGYGAGDMLLLFAEKGMFVEGFDFSPYAQKYALKYIEENQYFGNRIQLLKNSSEYKNKKYDFIFFFEVLEHIQNDWAFLEEMYERLKKNGYIIFSVPAHMAQWGQNDINAGHYRRYEKNELEHKLLKKGYKIKIFWNYPFPIHFILDIFLSRSAKKKQTSLKYKNYNERTKRSGIERKVNIFQAFITSDIILFPFYLLQNLFLEKDLASAYIIMAQKKWN